MTRRRIQRGLREPALSDQGARASCDAEQSIDYTLSPGARGVANWSVCHRMQRRVDVASQAACQAARAVMTSTKLDGHDSPDPLRLPARLLLAPPSRNLHPVSQSTKSASAHRNMQRLALSAAWMLRVPWKYIPYVPSKATMSAMQCRLATQ